MALLMKTLSRGHLCAVHNLCKQHWHSLVTIVSSQDCIGVNCDTEDVIGKHLLSKRGSVKYSNNVQDCMTENQQTDDKNCSNIGLGYGECLACNSHASVFRKKPGLRSHPFPSNNLRLFQDIHSIPVHLCIRHSSSDSGDSDSDDVKLVLEVVTPKKSSPVHVDIVPGKGPPPEPPIDCCMSGCANCVWIQYAEELKNYFTEDQGLAKAKEAIEQIENPGLQMFLKLELGLL